jgi:predicted RNase H-like nuclease (RuvC/YqgF family)
MKKNVPDEQLAGLKAYAEKKNKETIDGVNAAIDKLKRLGKSINFETVSKEAGVTRATLYNNAQLKERIQSLKGMVRSKPLNGSAFKEKDKGLLKDEKIAKLRGRINKLEEDNKKLFVQLVDFTELKAENERLKKQLLKGRISNAEQGSNIVAGTVQT